MAYRKKANFILSHSPDILVVPECEHPDKLLFEKNIPKPQQVIWYGSNMNKGLAVFSYSDYKLTLHKSHDPNIKTILPIEITGSNSKIFLLAVWAYNPLDPYFTYVGQIWKAIDKYQRLFRGRDAIIAGDFNSNVIWDKPNRRVTHKMLVDKLAKLNITSCYHQHTRFNHGLEEHPTFYLYRHKHRPISLTSLRLKDFKISRH